MAVSILKTSKLLLFLVLSTTAYCKKYDMCLQERRKCLKVEDIGPSTIPTTPNVLKYAMLCSSCMNECDEYGNRAAARQCRLKLGDFILTTCSRFFFECNNQANRALKNQACQTCHMFCGQLPSYAPLLTSREEEMQGAAVNCSLKFGKRKNRNEDD